MQVILDASRMDDKDTVHGYLEQELKFPDYYGKNLDALYDCLVETDALEIVFQNLPADRKSYFYTVSRVFTDAAAENHGLRIRSEE